MADPLCSQSFFSYKYDVDPRLLPSGNPVKYHVEAWSLQSMKQYIYERSEFLIDGDGKKSTQKSVCRTQKNVRRGGAITGQSYP